MLPGDADSHSDDVTTIPTFELPTGDDSPAVMLFRTRRGYLPGVTSHSRYVTDEYV